MEVKDDVAGTKRRIDRQREGQVVDCMFKSIVVFAFGVNDVVVVEEPGWPNQHKTILLNTRCRLITLHLEGARSLTALIFIHRRFIKSMKLKLSNNFQFSFIPFYSRAFLIFLSYSFNCAIKP